METTDLLTGKKHIHFIGIGGSGMFPIAQILHENGFFLTGSDNNETDTLALVRQLNIPVMMGQSKNNIEGADLIVYTAAILPDNEELMAAKASGVTVIERSVMLGILTRRYDNAMCVCGTHGKTTTSAMLTQILLDGGFDPTAVIGGKLPAIGGNGRVGKSNLMVCEACEFVDTFLKLTPDTTVLLNIDEDHMDYFKNMDNLIHSFHTFCNMTTKRIFANGDDSKVRSALIDISCQIEFFGFSSENEYYPENITIHEGIHTTFDFMQNGVNLGNVDIYVPGRHNVINAIAAGIAAMSAGASFEQVKAGLAAFHGAGRRFEILSRGEVTVCDDYAHHPAEIEATLKAAKELNFSRVVVVHQPFTYSRTKQHLNNFARVLSVADKVFLTPIMGSREKDNHEVTAQDLCNKIENAVCADSFEEVAKEVCNFAKAGDLIITMGCGDIYKAAKLIIKGL